jgi:ribosomal protein L37AE/L43A
MCVMAAYPGGLDKISGIVYSVCNNKMLTCPECRSKDLVRAGFRTWYRKHKEPQLKTKRAYLCRNCGRSTIKPKRVKA